MSEKHLIPNQTTTETSEQERSDPASGNRRRQSSRLLAGVFAGALALGNPESVESRAVRHEAAQTLLDQHLTAGDILKGESSPTFFDANPDFFRTITLRGDLTHEERRLRTRHLANGVEILQDVELQFYKVQSGDTLGKIRAKLSALPEFSFVKDQLGKLESFNIPARELQEGMWIPIPLENENRYITDEQFARYAAKAVEGMKGDPVYGAYTRDILKEISEGELIATLVAVAKQEAGGRPIGRYELHRWEPRYNVFSFSLFHVLMMGPGLEARRELNKSEGQLYHPQIATRLFIAFLKEKGGNPRELFPITKHPKAFASLYNGTGWREINPNYVRNILRYHKDAQEMLSTLSEKGEPDTRPKIVEVSPPLPSIPEKPSLGPKPKEKPSAPAKEKILITWERIGRQNLTTALREAHFKYIQKMKRPIFRNNRDLHVGAKTVMRYLRRKFGSDTYFPGDEIGIGVDHKGPYMKFRTTRAGKTIEALIRI